MKTIDINDTIFATIRRGFRTLGSFNISGVSDIDEALGRIRSAIGSASGLMTITLRNGNAGWSDTRSVVFA